MDTNLIFKVLALYGVVFALALNLGLYIPEKMLTFLKHPLCQVSLLYCACHTVTSNGLAASFAVLLHYVLIFIFHDHGDKNIYHATSDWQPHQKKQNKEEYTEIKDELKFLI